MVTPDSQKLPEPVKAEVSNTVYFGSTDVMASSLGDGLALFDMKSNSYFSLNKSGALIWQNAGEQASRATLHRVVAEAFAKTVEDVADDVDRAIDAMVDARLLVAGVGGMDVSITSSPPGLSAGL